MGLGDVIDSGDFNGHMEAAMSDIDWSGFEGRRKQSETGGRLRGIGMATYIERCGAGEGVPARVSIEEDNKVRLYSGALDSVRATLSATRRSCRRSWASRSRTSR